MGTLGTFVTKNPLGKFLLDIAVGAVIGAATATLALDPAVTGREAIGLIVGGATNGIRSIASSALVAALAALRDRS